MSNTAKTERTEKWLRVSTTAPATEAGYSRWLKEGVHALTREMRVQVKQAGGEEVADATFDIRLTMHQLVEIDAPEETA